MRTRTHKLFPPRLGQIQVPCSTRASTLVGMTLYTPCRPRAQLMHRMVWAGVRVFGPMALLGGAQRLRLPVESPLWDELNRSWRESLGEFDDIALYHRMQAERPGFLALLIQRGNPLAFLKCRPSAEAELGAEAAAADLVTSSNPTAFLAPRVLGQFSVAGWTTLAFEPLPAEPHRPLRGSPSDAIFEQAGSALGALPRSPQTPTHWTPSHGDCTPWNLRTTLSGTTILIDWERAAWAPPGSDRVLYAATAAAVLGAQVPRLEFLEAIDHWRGQFSTPVEGARDERLRVEVIRALDQVEGR